MLRQLSGLDLLPLLNRSLIHAVGFQLLQDQLVVLNTVLEIPCKFAIAKPPRIINKRKSTEPPKLVQASRGLYIHLLLRDLVLGLLRQRIDNALHELCSGILLRVVSCLESFLLLLRHDESSKHASCDNEYECSQYSFDHL